MKNLIFCSLSVFFGIFISFFASAEPWLANRYAQNCAACHAPGRLNRETPDRRCTLTCQGCHVSPQGGGMRNQYGVWNQRHWLRSFQSDFLKDHPTPAPLKNQPYAGRIEELASTAKDFYKGTKRIKLPIKKQ
jgi:hypothetical protein